MNQPFLAVERSLRGRGWFARAASDRHVRDIAQRAGVSDLLARVLAGREVAPAEADDYLKPTLRALMPAPETVRGLIAGGDRLAAAIIAGEPIGIIGDYDVDGMSASAIIARFLTAAGARFKVRIPDRLSDGYGPSIAAVDALANAGCRVLLTLDCGILAHGPLAHAGERGMETIVVDHHQCGEDLPPALAVIDPNRHDDVSGLGYLCAGGLAFMLAAVVNRRLADAGHWTDERPAPDLLHYLDLAALATVCDVVPLKGLNRALVRQGLKVMAGRANTGLAALADAARLSRAPDVHALGFVLGPRLNAAGRLGHADVGFELLIGDERAAAMARAQQLEEFNRRRQEIEQAIVDAAMIQASEAVADADPPVVVVAGEDWHPGVLGLVASRLVEGFARPAMVLAIDAGRQVITGSGRSLTGLDIGAAVRAAVAAGAAQKGGGHAMAAGVTLAIDGLDRFRRFVGDWFATNAAGEIAAPALWLDGALSASAASLDLIGELETAGPFGAGNPAPVFAFPAHRVCWADRAGSDHVRCTIVADDGARLKAIAFRKLATPLGEALLGERGHPLHIAGRLAVNDWGGRREAQLIIDDAAPVA